MRRERKKSELTSRHTKCARTHEKAEAPLMTKKQRVHWRTKHARSVNADALPRTKRAGWRTSAESGVLRECETRARKSGRAQKSSAKLERENQSRTKRETMQAVERKFSTAYGFLANRQVGEGVVIAKVCHESPNKDQSRFANRGITPSRQSFRSCLAHERAAECRTRLRLYCTSRK